MAKEASVRKTKELLQGIAKFDATLVTGNYVTIKLDLMLLSGGSARSVGCCNSRGRRLVGLLGPWLMLLMVRSSCC